MIFERNAGGIAQALDALCYHPLDVALAVVAIFRKIPQKIGIRTPRLQQLLGNWVHLGKAIVAQDDIQRVVNVSERAGHVVQRDMQLTFLLGEIPLNAL